MTTPNHVLTGAIIALTVKEPLLALPLAFVSHFALDMLPHFGMYWQQRRKYPKLSKYSLLADGVTLLVILVIFWLSQAPALVYVCGLVAMSPDFVWWYRFIILEKWGARPPLPMNRFNQWHSKIQIRESIKPGLFIEISAAIILTAVTLSLLI